LLQNNIRYVHVPYRGTADQMIGVAGGQVMAGVNSTGFAPWVDQGKIRVLAIFSAQRSPRWPDAPTLRELGTNNRCTPHPEAWPRPTAHPRPWCSVCTTRLTKSC
jgi:tripartite-type tricarboxylate transporter receptor subunit TctC